MTYQELFDTFQFRLKEMNLGGALPKVPKSSFITRVMLAAKSEDLSEMKRVIIKYENMRTDMPDLFGMVVLFIKEHMDEEQLS